MKKEILRFIVISLISILAFLGGYVYSALQPRECTTGYMIENLRSVQCLCRYERIVILDAAIDAAMKEV